eukprot:COSAG01_NODE_5002_length_4552_cov_22.563320_2_plen_220_part_00
MDVFCQCNTWNFQLHESLASSSVTLSTSVAWRVDAIVKASRFNPTKFFTPRFVWPEIYRFTGSVQYDRHSWETRKTILGDFKKTKVTSNNAPVYVNVNPKAWLGLYTVFLYLHKVPKTGELLWIIGNFDANVFKLEDVVHNKVPTFFKGVFALFDSSPSAKGGCAGNGRAAPACKWRECVSETGSCFAYPHKGTYMAAWSGASGSLKVVVGRTGRSDGL